MITFNDFKKLELRIGEITAAERVPETDKLLKLIIDVGTESRQVVAGMAEYYEPAELIGKQVPLLMNLEPKTLRGVESHGMILAVDVEGRPILLHPDQKVPPGSIVR
ncbi:MAG: methionine--tRNA ligase subunit beta [Deltaproteobacteria bacterium]|nr:MAG: methionine--tRNA ligase subunit beta [Deltaproteobacteria bacterium]